MNIWVNDDGDFEFDTTTNNLKLVKDNEEIRQIILSDLETLEGEWFLDTSIGVPWFTEIFQKGVTPNEVDGIIVQQIGQSRGVTTVLEYESSISKATRELSISFTVETVFGILTFTDEKLSIFRS